MMLERLKRHPFAVQAHFDKSIVLTFAVRPEAVRPFLFPGLRLDTWGGHAFLAAAIVQARGLRPSGWPTWTGQDFLLTGYRVFTRLKTEDGRELRGLRILRSDTDKRRMAFFGNRLTHYDYHVCTGGVREAGATARISITSKDGKADLEASVTLDPPAGAPPAGSPFPDLRAARKFAGPLPFTFDHERASGKVIVIQGERDEWAPRAVDATVGHADFIHAIDPEARLANAFVVSDVPYRWKRGIVQAVEGP